MALNINDPETERLAAEIATCQPACGRQPRDAATA
jgi:hypothetical protein